MKKNISRPNVESVLAGLKDFQRQTVEYVFRRVYLDADCVDRFLVADEVGLGKTLVARGIIAKTIDHLWDEVSRLDVIYICSNADIARQNISRLNITGNPDFALSSRITLLPLSIDNLTANKVNFVSFTPGTSLDLKYSTGTYQERALLYHMLKDEWDFGARTGPVNVLQCAAQKDYWRQYLTDFPKCNAINPELKEAFIEGLSKKPDIRERFMDLAVRFRYFRKHLPDRDRRERNALVGELRSVLAAGCVHALEPDLIILDEFQRFKHILDGTDQMSNLARRLFEYNSGNRKAKVLLLSATPYKMYTMHHEADIDDHYADLLRTLSFLFNSDAETEEFRQLLKAYRDELLRLGNGTSPENIERLKAGIEQRLSRVMVRTERLSSASTPNPMVVDADENIGTLRARDLREFCAIDRVAMHLKAGDHVEYWKSAPYLLNFMDDYALLRKLREALHFPEGIRSLTPVLKQAADTFLTGDTIRKYGRIDPANSKLRTLAGQTLDTGDWRLLWLAPSLPYYQPTGPYGEPAAAAQTKSLVFSSWRVVPKVISTLCSYEAERRAMREYNPYADYDSRHGRRPLLRFEKKDGRLTGMPLMCLIYPSVTLARRIDPLTIAARLKNEGPIPNVGTVLEEAKRRLSPLLSEITASFDHPGRTVDERWYWLAPALLDRKYASQAVLPWLGNAGDTGWRKMLQSQTEDDADTQFSAHVDYLLRAFAIRTDSNPGHRRQTCWMWWRKRPCLLRPSRPCVACCGGGRFALQAPYSTRQHASAWGFARSSTCRKQWRFSAPSTVKNPTGWPASTTAWTATFKRCWTSMCTY